MSLVKVAESWRAGLALAGLLAVAVAHAQVAPSAVGKSASFWMGAEYSNMHAGFPEGSSLRFSGAGVFADYNWNNSIGLEGHARFLSLDSWHGETERDFLGGPRYIFLHNPKWWPFATFQVGVVRINYPFDLGYCGCFAMVPGGGVEYHLNRKWAVRGAYEFQILPGTPKYIDEPRFGIKPNGVQVGISYRLF